METCSNPKNNRSREIGILNQKSEARHDETAKREEENIGDKREQNQIVPKNLLNVLIKIIKKKNMAGVIVQWIGQYSGLAHGPSKFDPQHPM